MNHEMSYQDLVNFRLSLSCQDKVDLVGAAGAHAENSVAGNDLFGFATIFPNIFDQYVGADAVASDQVDR